MTGELVPVTPAQEIAALEAEMPDRHSDYWRSETKQARYRELVDAREAGTAPPKVDARATELRRIERLMGDRRSQYWLGPKIDGETELQRRYRQLLAGEGMHDPARSRSTAEQAVQHLPAPLVSEWREGGQLEAKVRQAENQWSVIYHSIGDRDLAVQFQTSFYGLPPGVQAAILREAVAQPFTFIEYATGEQVAGFARQGGGAETAVARWGREAPMKVGRILARFDRAFETIPTAERADFLHWFGALTPRERFCLVWPLAQ